MRINGKASLIWSFDKIKNRKINMENKFKTEIEISRQLANTIIRVSCFDDKGNRVVSRLFGLSPVEMTVLNGLTIEENS